MELDSNNVVSEQLGHLGLVAATIKKLGIIDLQKVKPVTSNN